MLTPDEREVIESPKVQGLSEQRAYSFDFTAAGVTSITSAAQQVLDMRTLSDVSADVLEAGGPAPVGLVVTTTRLRNLEVAEYRLVCRVTHDGGQVSELYCRIFGRL